MRKKIWVRLSKNVFLILLITIPASILFWLWFGRALSIHFSNLEIDFFNTVCGLFTVVGLIIALYQISELKSEEEIREETIAQTHEEMFKLDTLSRFHLLKDKLLSFQQEIAATYYNKAIINGYFTTLNGFVNEINDTHNRQNSLKTAPIINCANCVSLLRELINECDYLNSKNGGAVFPKSFFFQKLGEIISAISECEYKLKV